MIKPYVNTTCQFLILFFMVFFCAPKLVGAASDEQFTVGLKLLAAWDTEREEGAEFALWYPAIKAEGIVNLGEWHLNAAKDAKEAEGKFPLIIISHDSGANKLSYNDTAAKLARLGFVVAVPTHRGDNSRDMSSLFTATQIFNRPAEVKAIIRHLQEPPFQSFVNTKSIGILGVGAGASTALILSGGVVDISSYAEYCKDKQVDNVYCSQWARQRLTTLSFYLPQPPDFAQEDIKAIALAVPAYSMLFTKESLAGVTCPVILYKGEKEPYAQADILRNILPQKPEFVVLPGMNAQDLASTCPEVLTKEPTWQCNSDSEATLSKRESRFNSSLESFFRQHLRP